jgi:hypothetical protein
MPHINHHRGETRQSINRSAGHSKGRNGLAKRAQTLAGFGVRNWCPCCSPMSPKDPFAKRWVSRLDRNEGKRQCRDWEVQDDMSLA